MLSTTCFIFIGLYFVVFGLCLVMLFSPAFGLLLVSPTFVFFSIVLSFLPAFVLFSPSFVLFPTNFVLFSSASVFRFVYIECDFHSSVFVPVFTSLRHRFSDPFS